MTHPAAGLAHRATLIVVAAIVGDDREVDRVLSEMGVGELGEFRRALTTASTYAANIEGRKRAQARKARGGW